MKKEKFVKFAESENIQYFVSDIGNIKRVYANHSIITKGNLNMRTGYYQTGYTDEGHTKIIYVHRLVAQYFVENPDGKKFVDHINSDRTDNRAENLRWVTRLENNSTEHSRKMHSVNHKSKSHKYQFLKAEKNGDIRYFVNAACASRVLGCSHVIIHNCLNPEHFSKTAMGWSFSYVDREDPECAEFKKRHDLELAARITEKAEKHAAEINARRQAKIQKKIDEENARKAEIQARRRTKKNMRLISRLRKRLSTWEKRLDTGKDAVIRNVQKLKKMIAELEKDLVK